MVSRTHTYNKIVQINLAAEQMVNFSTRQRATLDLFFTNQPSLVDKCLPAPAVADHDMVHIITSATARRNKPISRKIHLWKRANTNVCLSMIGNILLRTA
jgi:hypothetical protein